MLWQFTTITLSFPEPLVFLIVDLDDVQDDLDYKTRLLGLLLTLSYLGEEVAAG